MEANDEDNQSFVCRAQQYMAFAGACAKYDDVVPQARAAPNTLTRLSLPSQIPNV
jgi:hypothetical protein